MMRNEDRKVSHKLYGAWEYQEEMEDLNLFSQEGWQLEKGGCFHSVFVRDTAVRYIYQIDYAPGIQDKERYLELFTEQGWEYINATYNGWYYFRKEYREDMPEEEKEIYTDRKSLKEMQRRYMGLLTALMILLVVLAVGYCVMAARMHSLMILTEAIAFIVLGATIAIGLLNAKRVEKGEEKIPFIPMTYVYPFAIVLLIISIFV